MFEELGYKCFIDKKHILYAKENSCCFKYIIFDLINKSIDSNPRYAITTFEEQAINLQIKELGWIDIEEVKRWLREETY